MTKGGSFKRAVRRKARGTGQGYAQTRAQMHPRTRPRPDPNVSLPTLLAHALHDISREFERADPDRPSLLLWANLLRVIPDGGISLTDLPPAARISRRAGKAWLGKDKRGLVKVADAAPRGKFVTLTRGGHITRDRWRELLATTEHAWSARVRGSHTLRNALAVLVGRLDLELPHYPMTYGTSDPSAIGGSAVPAREGPPRIPPHGTDWVPVIRDPSDDVSALPLHALLSQTLMAFTIDYEEALFPMAVAAMLSRAMPTTSVPLTNLPAVLGVNGLGKSGLERHGIVRVTGNGDDRVATLTKVGKYVCDNHASALAHVMRSWCERYGDDVVDALVASLAEVDRQLPDDLPDLVLIRYVVGGGFTDVSFTAK